MKYLIVFTLASSLWGRDIPVKISSDSPDAAQTLLEKLNDAGKDQGLQFVSSEPSGRPDYKLVIQWRRGGPGYQPPTAEVQVFADDNSPLYAVTKRSYGLTRTGAVGRCARFIVQDMVRRGPRVAPSIPSK